MLCDAQVVVSDIRTVGGFWSQLNPHLSESAAVLGARPWRAFATITLPLLLPSILAAALLVVLFSVTSFGVVLILGGPRFSTLEVEIYRQAVTLFRLPEAAAISLVQIVLTFLVMALYTRIQARVAVPLNLRAAQETALPPVTAGQRAGVALVVTGLLLFLVLPLVVLAGRSLAAGDPARYYRELAADKESNYYA